MAPMETKNTRNLLGLIISIACVGLSVSSQAQDQSAAAENQKEVAYYLDASCENCTVNNTNYKAIWVATENITVKKIENTNALVLEFRKVLVRELKADSLLLRQVVIRYQDTEKLARESYAGKEQKMKVRGYTILKVKY